MAKVVEVWRLEHDKCPMHIGHVYWHTPSKNDIQHPKMRHGPQVYMSCGSKSRPPFGAKGETPSYISSGMVCGVTRRQYGKWWDTTLSEFARKKQLWNDAGWRFVVYKMPKSRVRWDNGQIIFNPGNALNRSVVEWKDVPLPR